MRQDKKYYLAIAIGLIAILSLFALVYYGSKTPEDALEEMPEFDACKEVPRAIMFDGRCGAIWYIEYEDFLKRIKSIELIDRDFYTVQNDSLSTCKQVGSDEFECVPKMINAVKETYFVEVYGLNVSYNPEYSKILFFVNDSINNLKNEPFNPTIFPNACKVRVEDDDNYHSVTATLRC